MSAEGGSRPGGGRLLVVLSVLFLLLAGLAAWFVQRRDGIESERRAMLALFRADIRAEEAVVYGVPAPLEDKNAAPHYYAAFAKWRQKGFHLVRKLDASWSSIPPDLAEFAAANVAALAEAEKGAAVESCLFDFLPSFPGRLRDECYGPPAQAEGLGTSGLPDLFAIRARIRLEEGRTAEAAADAVRVPRVVRHALHRTVRGAEEYDQVIRRGGEVLERILDRPDLDAAIARAVATGLLEWDRIDEDQAFHRRFHALLSEERILPLLAGGLSREAEDSLRRHNGLPARGILPGLSRKDLEVLRARREWWLVVRERAKSGAPPEGPPTPWMGRLTVLRAAFAIRARQLEKGAPPARLEALVPDLLPAVPRDPWGAGPLRYEVKGEAWSVESVGQVKVHRRTPAGDHEWAPLDLRIQWPPKSESPR